MCHSLAFSLSSPFELFDAFHAVFKDKAEGVRMAHSDKGFGLKAPITAFLKTNEIGSAPLRGVR
jgi:hypothetical protein